MITRNLAYRTKEGRRVLKLPERATEALKEHRPGVLPRGPDAAGPVAGPQRVRCYHQGRLAGGGVGTTRELRHSLVSILSAHGVRIEDISDLVGHSGTTVTETVYRHEIRPALTTGATAMDKILTRKRTPARFPTAPDR